MKILHFRENFSLLSKTFIYDSYLPQRQGGLDAQFATARRVDAATRPAEGVRLLRLPVRFHPRRIFNQLRGRAQRLPRRARPFPLYAREPRAAIEQLRPQVVHAHSGTAGVIAEVASRGPGVPLVVTMYGHDISRLLDVNRGLWEPIVKKYQLEGVVDFRDHQQQEALYALIRRCEFGQLPYGDRRCWCLAAKLVDYVALNKPAEVFDRLLTERQEREGS